jgi:hypothetical protein
MAIDPDDGLKFPATADPHPYVPHGPLFPMGLAVRV